MKIRFIAEKLQDGFECPKVAPVDSNGQPVAHPKFPHTTDCQRFYVCLNGVEPRDLGCQVGEVYNEETQKCDAPENVRGWFVTFYFTYIQNVNVRIKFTFKECKYLFCSVSFQKYNQITVVSSKILLTADICRVFKIQQLV